MKLTLVVTNQQNEVLYEKSSANHANDAGFDLYATEDLIIPSGKVGKIKSGVVGIPEDNKQSYMLFPRSSIYKTPLRLANSIGLIDAGYRGEIMAVVDNISNEEYTVKKGDRLVQLVAFDGRPIDVSIVYGNPEQVPGYSSERKTGGFGSTS